MFLILDYKGEDLRDATIKGVYPDNEPSRAINNYLSLLGQYETSEENYPTFTLSLAIAPSDMNATYHSDLRDHVEVVVSSRYITPAMGNEDIEAMFWGDARIPEEIPWY